MTLSSTLALMAALPAFVSLDHLSLVGVAIITATTAGVVGGVLMSCARLAASARRLLTSSRRVRLLNRTAGTAMAGSGVALVVRQARQRGGCREGGPRPMRRGGHCP